MTLVTTKLLFGRYLVFYCIEMGSIFENKNIPCSTSKRHH